MKRRTLLQTIAATLFAPFAVQQIAKAHTIESYSFKVENYKNWEDLLFQAFDIARSFNFNDDRYHHWSVEGNYFRYIGTVVSMPEKGAIFWIRKENRDNYSGISAGIQQY